MKRALLQGAGLAVAVAMGFVAGVAQESGSHKILGVYGVGGVLGDDGVLYQYMPDQKRWLSIDAAFQGEGRETHVMPLPVAAEEIQFMESWGFLVTKEGIAWHYDLRENRWENVGRP